MTAQDTIVQLNKYPPDKYNVLIPVTSMQVMSNMQKIIVNEVRLNPDPSGNDIYYDKQTGKYAITAVGGTKLAAAANISIISSESEQPEVCRRCLEMAKATGQAKPCGDCDHAYDVRYTVSIRVPKPSGGFRIITKSKEIDCSLEKTNMTGAQYKRFLPHRGSMAETKAYMRCLRSAMGLAQGYTKQELTKPFVVAHIVPNLDAPEMRTALINNTLRDMGLLFEMQGSQPQIPHQRPKALSEPAMSLTESSAVSEDTYTEGDCQDTETDALPWDDAPELPQEQGIVCADCGRKITEATGTNGQRWTPETIKGYSERRFGRCLCPDCQKIKRGVRR